MSKFYVHRTHTMDGLVIRWNPSPDERREISASRDGVAISGFWVLGDIDQRTELSKVISSAWNAYEQLKRGLVPPRYDNEVDVRFGETLGDVIARMEKL